MITTKQIHNTLIKYGIPMHISGFEYLSLAIDGCLNGKMDMHYVTKSIYPDVAKEQETTPSRVERAIRHAIKVSFEDRKEACMIERFKAKPVNSEFIATLVYELRED